MHEKLLLFEPKPAKHETLSDLFRNIQKEQQLKKLASTTNSDTSDEKPSNSDSVPTVPTFKTARETLIERGGTLNSNQSKIGDFFKKSSVEDSNSKYLSITMTFN